MLESISRLACACVIFGLAATGVLAQETLPDDPAPDAPQSVPPVADLFDARTEILDYIDSIGDLDTPAFVSETNVQIASLSERVAEFRSGLESQSIDTMPIDELLDLLVSISADFDELDLLANRLASRATRRDEQLDELAELAEEWDALTATARSRSAPEEVLDFATATDNLVAAAESNLRNDRDAALVALSSIADSQTQASRFRSEVRSRRDAINEAAQSAADAPLWSPAFWQWQFAYSDSIQTLSRYKAAATRHVSEHWVRLLLIAGLSFLGAYWLLKLAGPRVREFLQDHDVSRRAAAAFDRPLLAALLIALLVVKWFGPAAPAAFTLLISVATVVLATIIATTILGNQIRITIWTVAAVFILIFLKPLIEPMPVVSRLVLLAQVAALIWAILADYRHGRFKEAFPEVGAGTINWLVRVVIAALLLVAALDITGLVGAANTLRSTVFGALGLGVLFTAVGYLLTGIIMALLLVKPFSELPIVNNQRWVIVRTWRRYIRWFGTAVWIAFVLNLAGLLKPFMGELQEAMALKLTIGEISLNLSAIMAGIAVLLFSWLLSRFVRFLLAQDSMKGIDVAQGLTFAVSKLLRYAIAVAGFLFALAVMGFDITRVMVLVGALGVGIGIGLQNVVNNFVSGLILLFEQPIKPNDIAKVDDIMGTVRELGIRAAVIETFDGAEAVVPNADLVSKTVVNWTKSNRRRRAEIDVGVAYGSDPDAVLKIVENAARDNEGVMKDPEPFAIFTGFGDSSLNFRLYVWMADLGDVLRVPSKIRERILIDLNNSGIEIPFPQRDVRVTMSQNPQALQDAAPDGADPA